MVYEYECSECQGYFEIDIKLSVYEEMKEKDETPPCPSCKTPLKRIITKAPNFKLLGCGWFDQDYGITDMETRKNIDDDRRAEDLAGKDATKMTNIQEI